MPAERLPMRRIEEIIQLSLGCGLSARQVSRSLKVARSTVVEYLRRARAAGLSWSLPEKLDEETLERRLVIPCSTLYSCLRATSTELGRGSPGATA